MKWICEFCSQAESVMTGQCRLDTVEEGVGVDVQTISTEGPLDDRKLLCKCSSYSDSKCSVPNGPRKVIPKTNIHETYSLIMKDISK